MDANVSVAGYTACDQCATFVLDVIAFKTRGLCAECFRRQANAIIDPVMVIVDGRERLVLRTDVSRRKPGARAQRARARRRKRQEPDEKARRKEVAACADRARRRLQRLFPEMWEILLADERAKAGLNAFTIDRCLRGEPLDGPSSSLELLAIYHHIEQQAS